MNGELAGTLAILKEKKFSNVTFILGNISCDLDSAVSSVVYATFLNWQHQRLRDRVCTRQHRTAGQSCQQVFVPVLNVNREDYELKTEVAFCFRESNLNKESLLFRDDIDLRELSRLSDLKVILVDHHILAIEDSFLKPYVIEIVDHRPKDVKNWTYGDQVRADIQQVGSCATLICDRIRSNEEGCEFFSAFSETTQLLYGTIILDTVNFSKEVNKGTPTDLEQVVYLETLHEIKDTDSHRKVTLSKLTAARSDVALLSPQQLLRKDTKICANVLVPSFPVLVEEVLSLAGIDNALDTQTTRSRCNAAVLLGVRLSTPVRRDLAVYCPDDQRRDKIVAFLQQWAEPELQLSEHETAVAHCRYFTQSNLASSRKQVMPAVASYLAQEQ